MTPPSQFTKPLGAPFMSLIGVGLTQSGGFCSAALSVVADVVGAGAGVNSVFFVEPQDTDAAIAMARSGA
jgi:hypothetical protein